MFSWRNKKINMWIPPLICSYAFHLVTASEITFSLPSFGQNTGMLHESVFSIFGYTDFIVLDKRRYQVNIFLISPQKHMLWVHIRSISGRHF